MKVSIILIEGGTGHVGGEKLTWKWKGGYLRVYSNGTRYFEAPREKVLAIARVN